MNTQAYIIKLKQLGYVCIKENEEYLIVFKDVSLKRHRTYMGKGIDEDTAWKDAANWFEENDIRLI